VRITRGLLQGGQLCPDRHWIHTTIMGGQWLQCCAEYCAFYAA
jgi:hypothetical protein